MIIWYMLLFVLIIALAIVLRPYLYSMIINKHLFHGANDESSNDGPIINDARGDKTTYVDKIKQEMTTFNSKGNLYVDPASNRQINQISFKGNTPEKARLFRLLCPDGRINNFLR